MRWTCAVLFFFFSSRLLAQSEIPQDYFDDPLEVPVALAGTFGELRSNHFHSGIDIKTQQRQGLPVNASAEGFVSRIKVSEYGYGKALYIEHPNGYTTVYAHLKRFAPKIEKFIKKKQYESQSYEVEVFPSASELPVERGELIALSGNTGGSGGPHLHFEIRDSQQRPMNPLMFGIKVRDTRPPLVHGVFAYPIGEDAHVKGSAKRQRIRIYAQGDGSFKAEPIEACGKIGFGIVTVDRLNAAPNHNGVYRLTADANGQKLFQANFEKFSFAETRHLNQLIDYGYYQQNSSRIQKLFIEPSNPLSIYSDLPGAGYLNVQDSLSYNYRIVVRDFSGNQRIINIPVSGASRSNIVPKEEIETDYFVDREKDIQFEGQGITVDIPRHSLYKDAYLNVGFEKDRVELHEDVIPIHSDIRIGFDVSHYTPEERKTLFIASLDKWGNPSYSSTSKNGNRFSTETRNFGTYTLRSDTEAPAVWPVNFSDGQWISNNKDLRIKISDDLSGIDSYRATVNGKFILMEYEYKDNLLTHHFSDAVVTDTENHLRLEVTDQVGNTRVYEAVFFRKQQ